MGTKSTAVQKKSVPVDSSAASAADLDVSAEELRRDYPYLYYGAHVVNDETRFRVYAPNANQVELMRDANGWCHEGMERRDDGVWERRIPGDLRGQEYKFFIRNHNDYLKQRYEMARVDPFSPQLAVYHDGDGGRTFNSIVPSPDPYPWTAKHCPHGSSPMSIYELHLGTFRDGNYREIAEKIAHHVGYCGFTHVQIMPPFQTPIHESWGYLVGCPYAIYQRHGSLDDFRWMVNHLHEHGLGVIVDVPLGFGIQDWDCGLGNYDGTDLYHHIGARGWNNQWNTRIYNHRSQYVKDYLTGICTYLHRELGVDGARIDAVASQIFLDYDRGFWDWPRNDRDGFTQEHWDIINGLGGDRYFDNRGYFLSEALDFDAVYFFRDFHQRLRHTAPAFFTIAEESRRVFPKLATPVEQGGLGFTYAQNMGEMHRVRKFLRLPAEQRNIEVIEKILFDHHPEPYVNPMNTHDECANGKTRLITELASHIQLIGLAALSWFRPGAPMLFQGDEFCEEGWFDVWHGLDWGKTGPGAQLHQQQMLNNIRDLNRILREEPAFARQNSWDIESVGSNHEQKYYAFIRWGGAVQRENNDPKDHAHDIIYVRTESPFGTPGNVQVSLPCPGRWRVIYNSIDERYIGQQEYNRYDPYWAVDTGDQTLWIHLDPFQNIALKLDPS